MMTAERFDLPGTFVAPLFDAWRTGAVDLPPAVIDAGRSYLAALDRLRATPRATTLGVRGIAGREDAAFAAEIHRDAARASRDIGQGLVGLVGTLADEIIGDYLRPPFLSALDEVRSVAPALQGVDVRDTAAVSRARVGEPFLVLAGAAETIRAILAAQECVIYCQSTIGPAGQDPYTSSRTARGVLRDTRRMPDSPVGSVGPAHRLERTLWLATPEGEAWLPTRGEWEEAHAAWLVSPQRAGRSA